MLAQTVSSRIFELIADLRVSDLGRLLQDRAVWAMLDWKNENNLTALHVAATKVHHDLLQILLECGANPNLQNSQGQTPIWCLVSKLRSCDCETCTQRICKCIHLFGSYDGNMNITDENGDSPLHLAVESRNSAVVTALLQNEAVPNGTIDGTPILSIMFEKLPEVIIPVFDNSVSISGKGVHDEECELTFDISVILPQKVCHLESALKKKLFLGTHLNNGQSSNSESYRPRKEMGFLSDLLDSADINLKEYRRILLHPLVNVFIDLKWTRLELMFYAFLLLQVSMLVAYSVFIFLTILLDCPFDIVNQTIENLRLRNILGQTEKICNPQWATITVLSYVMLCIVAIGLKEIQHALMDMKEYVKDVLNYVQWVGLAAITTSIIITLDSKTGKIYQWLYPVSSFAITISWCQIFVQVGRIPCLAIYVDMLAKITVNFVWSLFVYSSLLAGFAMSYCILFPTSPSPLDIPLGGIKVLTMMVGELDYEGLFDAKETVSTNGTQEHMSGPGKHPIAAHLWYVSLVVFITLVLMNLLVGLAVSDIAGCRKNAELVVLKRRIRYIAYLEKSFFLATAFFPDFLKTFLRKRIVVVVPVGEPQYNLYFWRKSSHTTIMNSMVRLRPNEERDHLLSPESKKSIKLWLLSEYCGEKKIPKCRCKNRPSPSHSASSQMGVDPTTEIHVKSFSSKCNEDQSPSGNSIMEFGISRLEQRLDQLEFKIDKILTSLSQKADSD